MLGNLFKYIFFCFILLFTSSSPCHNDQFAVSYFSTSRIVLIWHHSLVCCCGLADILYVIILRINKSSNRVVILGPGDHVVSLKHFHTFFMPLIWRKYRDKAGMLFGECGELAFKYFFLFSICSYLFRKFIKTGVDIFARVLLQESRRRLTLTFTLVVYGQFLIRLQELCFGSTRNLRSFVDHH